MRAALGDETLIAAIDEAMRPRRGAAPAKARREKKRLTKNEETTVIRAQVFARAEGMCEMGCGSQAMELDHAFGRIRVPQAASNCLALCHICHRQKTNNAPSATYWLECYFYHFEKHGYMREAGAVAARLDSLRRIASINPR